MNQLLAIRKTDCQGSEKIVLEDPDRIVELLPGSRCKYCQERVIVSRNKRWETIKCPRGCLEYYSTRLE
jgi:hypothetical protein